MSLNLYSTALIWDGRRGAAKLHGRQIVLGEAPALLGARVVKIDYRPEIGEGRIQRMDGPTSDMTIPEVAAADEYLRHAVIGATIGVDGAGERSQEPTRLHHDLLDFAGRKPSNPGSCRRRT